MCTQARLINVLLLSLLLVITTTSLSYSQLSKSGSEPSNSRVENVDTPLSVREELRQHGIELDLILSQFYQGLTHGDGDGDWQYGGKTDIIANIDMERLFGLWPGLSVNIHHEFNYGKDVNSQGDGTLLPVNTALAFPRLGGSEQDLSIVFTQRFGTKAILSLGKFNMLDAAARTPLLGGGGLDTFQHIGLAAPISGVTPPYLIGGSLTVPTQLATYTLLIYDPRNAQDFEVIKNPFSEGVTYSLSATIPVSPGGLNGYHNLRGVYSNEEGVDLRDIPQLVLPPALRDDVGTRKGYYYASYSFQQFLWQNADDPSKGWGIFGEAALSEGNPNPFLGHYFIGLGGNSPLPGRLDDRWGIAYFSYRLSDELRIAARRDLGIGLEEERGIEAFYNFAITPKVRLTGSVEIINPFLGNKETSVFTGIRMQARF